MSFQKLYSIFYIKTASQCNYFNYLFGFLRYYSCYNLIFYSGNGKGGGGGGLVSIIDNLFIY